MKTGERTRYLFEKNYLEVFTVDENDCMKGDATKIYYSMHAKTRKLAWKFADRVAALYSGTAFGHICTRCGKCCRRANALVKGSEIFDIALRLGISAEQFRKRHLEDAGTWNEYDGYIKLKRGKCPFLKKMPSGRYSCHVYEVRPQSCRDFSPVSHLCEKHNGILLDHLEKMVVKGDRLEIHTTHYENEETREGKTVYELPVIITDQELLDTLKEISDEIEATGGKPINLPDREAEKTLKIIRKISKNISAFSSDPEFDEIIREAGELIEHFSMLITRDGIVIPILPELKEAYSELLRKIRGDEQGGEEPVVLPPAAPLFELDGNSVASMHLIPDTLILNFSVEGTLYPFPVNITDKPALIKKTRELVREVVTREAEELQSLLTSDKPPCYLCGECCSIYAVEINSGDVLRLADNLGVAEKFFRKKYGTPPRFSFNPHNVILSKEAIGEKRYCSFLEKREDGFYYCSVHTFKPAVCRSYPATNALCRKTNNSYYWYRLTESLERIEVDSVKAVVYSGGKKVDDRFTVVLKEHPGLKEKIGSLVNEIQSLSK